MEKSKKRYFNEMVTEVRLSKEGEVLSDEFRIAAKKKNCCSVCTIQLKFPAICYECEYPACEDCLVPNDLCVSVSDQDVPICSICIVTKSEIPRALRRLNVVINNKEIVKERYEEIKKGKKNDSTEKELNDLYIREF